VFALSATHLMEVTAIKDPRQRANIADVMAELSNFTYMLGRHLIEELEVEGSLAELLGPEVIDLKPVNLLGFGASYPFGEVMSWSPNAEGNAAFARIRAQVGPEAADRFLRWVDGIIYPFLLDESPERATLHGMGLGVVHDRMDLSL
jgi:hypothetical protein